MSSLNTDPNREAAWRGLCQESGWCCKVCGAFPEIGTQFERNVCEDCRLLINNYDPTVT
jgi:hypothetical protein